MPWTTSDYPPSWKNLAELERKKAIDIGNALLKDGYPEERAIPIATKQAEEWYQKANKSDKQELKNKHVQNHEKKPGRTGADTLDEPVHVRFRDGKWEVKSENAKQASATFSNKEDAEKRAQEIAENKGTKVISHKKDE
ncbi:DUF2188 domain-containing protein [Listeria sp. PSOL-1]|uniref:DUF2188 domain-containing protein n=1 Tax=Listeria sp. PSOL-1 TaxID=1844999 RepID=UPI0013D6D5E5|nr:DUF2188 domain-containing protein [Listeria sp. PSOL-1]